MANIAAVAGEPSGDLLASRIIQGVQASHPSSTFYGIGGPNMAQTGMDIIYPMSTLSIFGYAAAIKKLPRLLSTFHGLKKHILHNNPDVFLGVDAPDFNLRLSAKLKQRGIPTVQFVSPSIWAWRYERIHKIKTAIDHMLVLFPFEEEIYNKEGIPVTYVGHPLAKQIPFHTSQVEARKRLGLGLDSQILAVLPGSRASEIKLLAPVFLKTCELLAKHNPELEFIVPIVNEERKEQFLAIAQSFKIPNLYVYDEQVSDRPISWELLEACDATLVSSGTATLEAALFKKPMVISYILSPLMKHLMAWQSGQKKPLVPWVGLPNILEQEFVVPELLQEDATPKKLLDACINALENETHRLDVIRRFEQLHKTLALDTPKIVAKKLIEIAND